MFLLSVDKSMCHFSFCIFRLHAKMRRHTVSSIYAIEAARAGEHGKGFAVVAAEVRKQTGKPDLTVGWQAVTSANRIPLLQNGTIDLECGSTTNNTARAKDVDFAVNHFYTGTRLLVKKSAGIKNYADLKGKTTAQSLTSNWYDLATESGAKVEGVEGWAQAVLLLKQGRVDATINDKLTFLDYEKTDGPTGLKIAAETDEAGEQAFVATKEHEALITAIDGALDELRADGTLAEISDKYFGADVTE